MLCSPSHQTKILYQSEEIKIEDTCDNFLKEKHEKPTNTEVTFPKKCFTRKHQKWVWDAISDLGTNFYSKNVFTGDFFTVGCT